MIKCGGDTKNACTSTCHHTIHYKSEVKLSLPRLSKILQCPSIPGSAHHPAVTTMQWMASIEDVCRSTLTLSIVSPLSRCSLIWCAYHELNSFFVLLGRIINRHIQRLKLTCAPYWYKNILHVIYLKLS